MSERNVDVIRGMYDFFNEWGADPSGQRHPGIPLLLHEEIEFHTHPSAPEAGVYRGRESVISYHERVFAQFERVQVEVDDVEADGDRLVVSSRQHTVPHGSDAEIVQRVVEVWTLRDGLLAERRIFPTRAEAIEAATSP